MAKPVDGQTGKGGKGGSDSDGGGGKVRNQAPIIEENQTLSFYENGSTDQQQFVIASDPENGQLTYALVDNYGGLFSINASTGEITVNDSSALDYESGVTQYQLQVVVTDDARKALSTSSTISVEIMDSNEHAPEFVANQPSTFTVDENLTNVVIGSVSATDSDGTSANNTITYSLSGQYSGYFSIDESGEITLLQALDFESISSLDLTVIASDGELTTEKQITIHVNDLPDSNTTPMNITDSGDFTVAGGGWENTYPQLSPYTLAIDENDTGTFSYDFSLTVSNLPGDITFNTQISGDAYSSSGAYFTVQLDDPSAFSGFYLQGSITYQGDDNQGNDLFSIDVLEINGVDDYANQLYSGTGINSEPWFVDPNTAETYWNPVDFGLSFQWGIDQYEAGSLIDSTDFLTTLNILDIDSDLEDMHLFRDGDLVGSTKQDVEPTPIQLSQGDIVSFDYFDADASVIVLQDVLSIEPELNLFGDIPLTDIGNNQYQVTADAGTYNFSADIELVGLLESYDFQLVIDS